MKPRDGSFEEGRREEGGGQRVLFSWGIDDKNPEARRQLQSYKGDDNPIRPKFLVNVTFSTV